MPNTSNPFQYNTKERFDIGANRVLTNQIIKAALSGCGDPFGFVTAAFKIDADPLELLQTAPGLIHTLSAGGHLKKGTFLGEDADALAAILDKLISVLAHARSGDEFASKRVQAIEKRVQLKV